MRELLDDDIYLISVTNLKKWTDPGAIYLPAREALLIDSLRDKLVPSKCGSRWVPKPGTTTLFTIRCDDCGAWMIADGNHRFGALVCAGRFDDRVTVYVMAGRKWSAGVGDFSKICKCRWTRKEWKPEETKAYE